MPVKINNVVHHPAIKNKKFKKAVVFKMNVKTQNAKLKKNKKSSRNKKSRQLIERKMSLCAKSVKINLQHQFIKINQFAENVF